MMPIKRDTDFGFTLSCPLPWFAPLEFYCDLQSNNAKVASFLVTRESDTVVKLSLTRAETKVLPLGIAKGTLLFLDSTNKLRYADDLEFNVSINRTEVL